MSTCLVTTSLPHGAAGQHGFFDMTALAVSPLTDTDSGELISPLRLLNLPGFCEELLTNGHSS